MSKVHTSRSGYISKNTTLSSLTRNKPYVTGLGWGDNRNYSRSLLRGNAANNSQTPEIVVDTSGTIPTGNIYSLLDTHSTNLNPFNSGSAGSLWIPGGRGTVTAAGVFFNGEAGFTFGTGDFTIEMWIYSLFFPASGGQNLYDGRTFSGSAQLAPTIYINGNKLTYYVNGANRISHTTSLNTRQWYHIAIVRASSVTTMYLDGVAFGTTYADTNNYISPGNHRPIIGTANNASINATNTFTGFISNCRICKGLAVYTGNFTVPTGVLGATQSAGTNIAAITTECVLLLRGEETNLFADSSGTGKTTVRAWPRQSHLGPVNYSPFNDSGSVYGAGVGGLVTLYSTDFALDTAADNFTLECWVNPQTTAFSNKYLFSTGADDGTGTFNFFLELSGVNGCVNYYTGGSVRISGSTACALDSWTHICVERVSSTTRLYVGGVYQGQTTSNPTALTAGHNLYIGWHPSSATSVSIVGYISDVRLVKGSAVYNTGNSNLTPPTAKLTAVSNTKLLLNFLNYPALNDSSDRPKPVKHTGNAKVTTSTVKYGSGAIALNGQGGVSVQHTTASSAVTDDFSIDGWFYVTTWTSPSVMFWWGDDLSTNTRTIFQITTTPSYQIITGGTTRSTVNLNITLASITNVWFHMKFIRSNTGSNITYVLYINGAQAANSFTTATFQMGNAGGLTVGGNYNHTYAGYATPAQPGGYVVDELRYTPWPVDIILPTAEVNSTPGRSITNAVYGVNQLL